MEISAVKQLLRGPMIPVITNLNSDLSVDHDAIRENVGYVVDHGIVEGSGVLLAVGAGGDFPMLTVQQRKDVCKTIVEATEGKTPVLVGAQDTDPSVSIEMARWSEEIGAIGIQMSPGYYYASSDEDCLRFVDAVHSATSDAVIMLYNTHWEGYSMSLDQLERLAEFPRCQGLKWSTPVGGSSYLRGIDQFADRMAVVDNQGLQVMNHLLGGTGYITHLATIWPEHDLQVWNLLEAGDYSTAQELISRVNWPWSTFRGTMWNRTAAESPVVKAALELCGRPGGPCQLPTRSLNDQERAELHDILQHIGVPTLVS